MTRERAIDIAHDCLREPGPVPAITEALLSARAEGYKAGFHAGCAAGHEEAESAALHESLEEHAR